MERLILARHGESEASAAGVVNGDPARPVRLTERGLRDAARLRVSLADDPIDLCVFTEFARTRETAEAALATREIRTLVLADFNDPVAGAFEGRPIGEFREWFRRHGAATPVPGGESRVETVRRYVRGLRELARRRERAVLLISHGLPVTYTVRAARGEDLPLTLERAQVDHAVPYRLSLAEVEGAIEAMEAWAAEREAAA
jgi:probable phosphoglycerate mutase